MKNPITQFKVINLLEGLSFLALLFVAMPIKYQLGEPMAVTIAGWVHGILFIAYVVSANYVAQKLHWPEKNTFKVIIAGMIPFAFLLVSKKLREETRLATAS